MAALKILVAGATGNQGGGVVLHSLKKGHQVRALVRDANSTRAQELKAMGAELFQGDMGDPASLSQAVKGTDAVFCFEVQTGDAPGDLQRFKNVVEAAVAEPTVTTFIVSTALKTGEHASFPGWGPDYPMYGYWMQKHAIEELVRGAGFKYWTVIRPAHILQNLIPPVNAIAYPGLAKDRCLRTSWRPDLKLAFLDGADVGIVVAEALSDPEGFSGREIALGNELLTPGQLVEKLTAALGEEITIHYYSDAELAALREQMSPVPEAHRWANEVPGEEAVEAAKEFPMTPVSNFLERHKSKILR